MQACESNDKLQPMKKVCFYIIILAIILISCEKENAPDSFPLGIENEFKINDVYHSSDNSLKFSITEINDSRCPSDVECIWAGKADVTIKLESPVSESFVLSTLNNALYSSKDTVGNYSFQLIDVSPYPVSTQIIKFEDYKVTLKIEKL